MPPPWNEPPLNDSELRLLRGMMDEYVQHEARDRFLWSIFKSGKTFAVAVGAVFVFAVQVLTLYATFRYHGGK